MEKIRDVMSAATDTGKLMMLRVVLLLVLTGCSFPASAVSMFTVKHEGGTFDVVRLERGEEQRLGLYWKSPGGAAYGTIQALRDALIKEGKELLFATNGGIYSKSYTPLGLYIENGKRHYKLNRGDGGGNFFLLPNGVFFITDQGAAVVETRDYNPKQKVRHAVQSGPMLVSNGRLHPRFIASSASLYIRNGVGVDREGRVIFAISDMPVNFHDFATLFRDRLDVPNALYLDGSISAMYAPELNRYGGWGIHSYTSIIGLVGE